MRPFMRSSQRFGRYVRGLAEPAELAADLAGRGPEVRSLADHRAADRR